MNVATVCCQLPLSFAVVVVAAAPRGLLEPVSATPQPKPFAGPESQPTNHTRATENLVNVVETGASASFSTASVAGAATGARASFSKRHLLLHTNNTHPVPVNNSRTPIRFNPFSLCRTGIGRNQSQPTHTRHTRRGL